MVLSNASESIYSLKTLHLGIIAVILIVIVGVVGYYAGTGVSPVTTQTVTETQVQTVYHTTTQPATTEVQTVYHTTTITTTVTVEKTTTTTTTTNCDSSYPDVCIPPPPPDLDCSDIQYRNFRVLPPDPHRFDGDKDGIGCET